MKPEKLYRIGLVSASVFLTDSNSESGDRKRRRVNVPRRYKDGKEWKSSTYFGLSELPQAMSALRLATEYVESCEAEVSDQ